jgi:hypothetical protein
MGVSLIRTGAAAAGLFFLALAGAASAQDIRTLAPGASPAAAALQDMHGIVGDWVAKDAAAGFSAPAAGEIVGHLLLYTDAGPRVQEMWIIRPEGESVLVRQKHYAPDLSDREAKDVWGERRLVARDADHLYFENLTFVRKGDGLDLLVRIPGQNGAAPTLLTYNFQRVR